tara:strand:+ start:780 stop:1001 length:222 start_codon:yes stop_codon:yes gene_type:complete
MSDKIIESRTSNQFVTDAPVEGNSAPSAGLSPHSGGSNESETMEESALQHLNVSYVIEINFTFTTLLDPNRTD